ncbi:hypothetical protein Tco_0228290 [Tanacetum coccineum]
MSKRTTVGAKIKPNGDPFLSLLQPNVPLCRGGSTAWWMWRNWCGSTVGQQWEGRVMVMMWDGDDVDGFRNRESQDEKLEVNDQLELNTRNSFLISFDFKTKIEFNYKSRTYGFIESKKRLETNSLKGR